MTKSALTLLVLCIFANHTDHTFSAYDPAVTAHFFNRCSNFHVFLQNQQTTNGLFNHATAATM